MRIRTKFLAVLLVELISFTALSGLSVATFARVRGMKTAVENGQALISRSRRVYSLLKDVVFDLFTPESYQALRSVVLAPRSLVTGREFAHETGLFRDEYRAFVKEPAVASILKGKPELAAAYESAAPLAEQAFRKFEGLSVLIERVRELEPSEDRDLYLIIQESKDETLYGIFGEIRDASFYLNNIFESFLGRFVMGIKQEAEKLELAATFLFAAAVIVLGALTVAIVYLLTSGILASIRNLQSAIGRVAEGDFSVRVPIRSKDELGALGQSFQSLAADLKRNVESIPTILKDVNEALPEDPDRAAILEILSDALLREGGARSVCLLFFKGEELLLAAKSGLDPLPGWEPGDAKLASDIGGLFPGFGRAPVTVQAGDSRLERAGFSPALACLLALPMAVRKRSAGCICFAREDRPFTDLERSRLSAIADYAAQILDSVELHAALAARREAGFEALQSQIQPHFLFNVLTSIMALNRMGDRLRLESALVALKEMLRYTLSKDQWASVGEEFAFLERYCDLQKLRHGERIGFMLLLAPEARELRIPRLIIQPLAENALIHGLEPKPGRGSLAIDARVERRSLIIAVRDDGLGCDPEGLGAGEYSRPQGGMVGLGNVRKRLQLLYKDARMELSGARGAGFSALLTIPLDEIAASETSETAP